MSSLHRSNLEPAEIEGEVVFSQTESHALGVGSYGAVYRAKIGMLPCAVKILHPTLFQAGNAGSERIRRLFERECEILRRIRHPYITQYIKSYVDPKSNLPVLLMELMDESLTHFLERVKSVRHHILINLAHDVGLALEFLHSIAIIHRDLSSNNVLLIAGKRAKVSDFGMVRLLEGHTRMTPATFCPGTMAYMPPEAFNDEPVYHAPLDCFSAGVIFLQMLTCLFPDPGPRVHKVTDDPRYPSGIEVIVPEHERRQGHIEKVSEGHPLLLLALDCMRDSAVMRPSAQEICSRIDALKGTSWHQYVIEQEQREERREEVDKEEEGEEEEEGEGREGEEVEEAVVEGEGWEEEQQEIAELHQQVGELQQILEDKERSVEELQNDLSKKTKEVTWLRSELEARNDTLAEKQRKIYELRQDLQQALENANLSPGSTELKSASPEGREPLVLPLASSPASGVPQSRNRPSPTSMQLQWRFIGTARKTYGDSCTAFGSCVYFADALTGNLVVMYNSHSNEWTTLPQCPKRSFAIAIVKGLLTAVGGFVVGEGSVKTLLSLTGEGHARRWSQEFPAMRYCHNCPAAVSTPDILVVIGGTGLEETSRAVEVMDTSTQRWSTASSLPFPLWRPTAVVCGDRLYLGGGIKEGKPQGTHSVLTCRISELQASSPSANLPRLRHIWSASRAWRSVARLPVVQSTLVSMHGRLLSIGGRDDSGSPVPSVFFFSPSSNAWQPIGSLSVARSKCFAVVLPEDQLMVVGGCTSVDSLTSGVTDSIETAVAI